MSNEMDKTPNQNIRDQIIENDLGWVKDLHVTNINGELMLGGDPKELPYNISRIIEEKQFVRQWLIPFAVGNSTGVNYFNQEEWFSFTMAGSRAVLVAELIEETGQYRPVMVIPPLLSINFSSTDRLKLRQAAGTMYANGHDANKKHDLMSNMRVANALANPDFGLQAKRMTLPDLIDPAFFAKYSIVPEIEQTIYWLRDIQRKGLKTEKEDLNRVREILFKAHQKKKVARDEHMFLYEFSLHAYELEAKLKEEGEAPVETDKETGEVKQDGASNKPTGPFDC